MIDEDDFASAPKKGVNTTHGGCGQKQLKYKKAPLKIILEKINPKDEVGFCVLINRSLLLAKTSL
jgi:hypothetical protein